MSTENLVKIDFKLLLKNDAELKTLEGIKYYTAQEALNKSLRQFIRMADLSVLNGKQVLQLCDLVQRHRPVALHSFLITCGRHIK